MCAEVAPRFSLCADLGNDQVEDILDDLATLYEFDRRNLHALLIDLLKCTDRCGGASADIDVVNEVGDESDKRITMVNG